MSNEALIYQRIGEFVVAFQSLEQNLREIGWFILDPSRKNWPPQDLRNLTNEKLIAKVHELFITAIPSCKLDATLESDLQASFDLCVQQLHQLRRNRNRILHSAFIEMKAGRKVRGLMRTNTRLEVDGETGEILYDQEILTTDVFDQEMQMMADTALFLDQAYIQLIHRYPQQSA